MGYWSEIEPRSPSRKGRDTPWIFATYSESPHERDDGQSYTAFLFRNTERTVFGIKEFVGDMPHHNQLRNLATKIINDKSFRNELVSDDPDLPNMWKKR
jgi:hypothetical protein